LPPAAKSVGTPAQGHSDPDAVIALGRIIDAWGVRGWVKVEPFAQASDTTLTRAPRWHLQRNAAIAGIEPLERWAKIERARRHSAGVVAKFHGCDDRDSALALKGAEVGVKRSDFPALPEGEFYWIDLIGCALTNPQEESLGVVTAMDDHGAHPILQTDTGVMVPFVDAYLIEVDLAQRRIVVDWQADWSR